MPPWHVCAAAMEDEARTCKRGASGGHVAGTWRGKQVGGGLDLRSKTGWKWRLESELSEPDADARHLQDFNPPTKSLSSCYQDKELVVPTPDPNHLQANGFPQQPAPPRH